MPIKLVVGLGNPGERYDRTRHNVGFRVVEHLAGADADWKEYERGLGRFTRRGPVFLAEPWTFMNESGRFVQPFAAFYKILPEEILLVSDEIALPLGRLRIKAAGSAGGQNGLKSVFACLGTQSVPRLRLGIGPQTPGMDSAAFVLQKFSASEEKQLSEVLEQAGAATLTAIEDGLETAMNRFNGAAA